MNEMSFGFSPAEFKQIIVFTDFDLEAMKKIVHANPKMEMIVWDSGHRVYVAGIRKETT